ncbi:SDR family NAD(P)-dependent oxidoreductase [Nocardioides sp. AE5]|uniref:SDR family NAD(P)-dependent oxidoreductase n=1 Tax=Nocardioides sp. AE5 TaxID=2962573 RepID=UPI0028823DE9|nr:SDR family NAD(P)-dependent oxidoreductase [Nocardioides sp. AE5]MDT0201698.1 SDR family NAD(P)-dependent oxidoreductase [Nocardioides sp. AE5]
MTALPLSGQVALVTGAGRGLGRSHALHLSSLGAAVVVNDLEVSTSGGKVTESAAAEVVALIEERGGRALHDGGDCSSFDVAEHMVANAVATFGRLDILVNNAGILRDRMVFNLDAAEWDDVIRVHLRGHAAPLRAAARHWRSLNEAPGRAPCGRVVNTVSESGLYGNAGQTNYSAAKAGIAALTQAAARELIRHGVTVNAMAPRARTRMVEHTWGASADGTGAFGAYRPEHVSAFLGWLVSDRASSVTGQVFTVFGNTIQLMQGWPPASSITYQGEPSTAAIDRACDVLFATRERRLAPFPYDPSLGMAQQ